MPSILSTFSFPFVLVVSVPLALFATWTTTLALCILALRVSVVYAELFAALLQTYLLPSTLTKSSSTSPSTPAARLSPPSPASRRSSRSSSIGSGILHRAPVSQYRKTQSTVTLANGNGSHTNIRDYEGVGGWRLQGEDDEEALWMGMNSRLQLPASSSRSHSHRGSWAIGLASGQVSPELVRTPRPKTPVRGVKDGTASPESYFMTQVAERGSRVSFSFEERPARSLAGSCVSLNGSVKVTQRDG